MADEITDHLDTATIFISIIIDDLMADIVPLISVNLIRNPRLKPCHFMPWKRFCGPIKNCHAMPLMVGWWPGDG
jgi:hypothetical protein